MYEQAWVTPKADGWSHDICLGIPGGEPLQFFSNFMTHRFVTEKQPYLSSNFFFDFHFNF